jgi:hypothetical protein
MSAEKGKNIGADLKQVSVQVEVKPEELEILVEQLIAGRSAIQSGVQRNLSFFALEVA